ncbi:MAG: acetylxylan esterase, partial [Turicibacter sp.]
PPLTKEADFDEFWYETRKIAQAVPLDIKLEKYDFPSPYVDVYDISYNGFDETRIHGWYLVPTFTNQEKMPCLIHYHGFTGNRGFPHEFMEYVLMGISVVSIDCREQSGETGNRATYSSGMTGNVVCKGILDKNEYYFRAVYMDCLKAIDFAVAQPEVDANRLIIEGGSQGGALGMAICALDPRPYLCLVDVPSNSNLTLRVENENGAFSSVTQYLRMYPERVDMAYKTLSYFDTMNLADRIQCKVLASVGLKDNVCPPKLYFATYNRITSEKDIKFYPFNGHEGGHRVHQEIKLRFIRDNI